MQSRAGQSLAEAAKVVWGSGQKENETERGNRERERQMERVGNRGMSGSKYRN